jgi:FtsP/CotA-like multicopper oxidase with cupredoxin domain
MEMITSKLKWMRLAILLALGLLAFNPFMQTQKAKAATSPTGIVCTSGPNFSLTAQAGYIQMPDMNTMYMWSYGVSGVGFQHPGPVMCVNQGDTVTVTLINSLPYGLSSSIIFPGQEDVLANGVPVQPEFDGNGKLSSLTKSAPSGGSVTYSFVASRPGTFIYESGTDPKTQVPMGMFGALIVRPAGNPNWAYAPTGNPDTSSQFDPNEEFLALLSEIDPFQHAAWEVGLNQGKNFNLNNYRARYWMINGRGFPDSVADNNASWLPTQPYGALARIEPYDASAHPYHALERFVNVGTEEYPFHPHGQNGLVIGRDGYPLVGAGGEDLSFEKFAVNIGPGQTWDVLFRWYDAEGYNSATNPVPVTVPDLVNVMVGMFFSGSPYLGETQTMPPGTNTLNQCGEYYIISHNHALFQLDAFGQTMSGPITYLRIDPPGGCP